VFAPPLVAYSTPLGYGAPLTYYDSPDTYAPSPVYVPPPSYYSAPAAYGPSGGTITAVPTPPPPPTQNVVEYPHGRYELRGDGLSTPYTWVWIPNPPAPPPAPPGTDSSSQLYRWTDEQGVEHWTDRLNSVPPQLRSQLKRPS